MFPLTGVAPLFLLRRHYRSALPGEWLSRSPGCLTGSRSSFYRHILRESRVRTKYNDCFWMSCFTFMHFLADAFIQSDIIKIILFFFSTRVAWESNPQHLRCKHNAVTTEPQEHFLVFLFISNLLIFQMHESHCFSFYLNWSHIPNCKSAKWLNVNVKCKWQQKPMSVYVSFSKSKPYFFLKSWKSEKCQRCCWLPVTFPLFNY